MQHTQLESWDHLKDVLGERQHKILLVITRALDGATLFELAARMEVPINQVSGRVTELAQKNLIKPAGKRMNPKSGKLCTVWKSNHFTAEKSA